MNRTRWISSAAWTLCSVAVAAFTLWCSAAPQAQEHHPGAPEHGGPQSHRQMLNASGFFPAGTILGEYAGTLYCLRHDFSGSEADKATCQKEGRHVHALVMKEGYVHPLYGVNEEAHAQIHANALHGKQVKVKGKFYPTNNAILVGAITSE